MNCNYSSQQETEGIFHHTHAHTSLGSWAVIHGVVVEPADQALVNGV